MQHGDKTKTILGVGKKDLWKRVRIPAILGIIALIILVITLIVAFSKAATRIETYKDASGAAGLNAKIDYNCPAPCEQKFNFNVYVLTKDGQQVGVFRPTQEGRVQFALAEGEYVMLIGKQFGQAKEFPQEPLTLKNGKVLELGLRY